MIFNNDLLQEEAVVLESSIAQVLLRCCSGVAQVLLGIAACESAKQSWLALGLSPVKMSVVGEIGLRVMRCLKYGVY